MLRKKNVLIISSEFPPDPGGIGNHAYNLASHLTASSFRVTVVADIIHHTKDLETFIQSNSFELKPVIRKSPALKTYIERIKTVLAVAKHNDYIICSGKFSLWLLRILKSRYPKKKFIAIVHGSELDLKNTWARKFVFSSLEISSCIISVSDYTKSFIPATVLAKIPCFVVPNGINIKEFGPAKKNAVDPLKLVTIGSVTERKGQANVIKALPAILRFFPNAQYHIVGKPVLKDQLLELAASLQVDDRIIFHGAVERKKLISILGDSSIKMMLSNHTAEGDFEGFGIAILEANACGRPAVGSNFGGITNAVKDNYNGLLVDPYNPDEIAAAVKTISDNYNIYAEQAVVWAHQHDWTLIIQQYISIVDSL